MYLHMLKLTFGYVIKYFYVDGWQYWIMSDNPNDCKILNRAREGLIKPKPIPEKFL